MERLIAVEVCKNETIYPFYVTETRLAMHDVNLLSVLNRNYDERHEPSI